MKNLKALKSLWPAWIPYPTSWIEASILALMMAPLGHSIQRFTEMGINLTVATKNLGPAFLFLVIGYVFPFVGFAYVHSFLWGNRPLGWSRKLPSPRSIFESFYALSINVIATLAAITVLLFIMNVEHSYTEEESETLSIIAATIWLILAAYLCQVKRWIWRGIESELEVKLEKDQAAGLKTEPRKKYI